MFDSVDRINISEVNHLLATDYTEANLLRRSRRGTFPAAYKEGHSPALWNAEQVMAYGKSKAGAMLSGERP